MLTNAHTTPDIAVIIVAAGRGTRMGGGVPKQWRTLAGVPVVAQTIAAFHDAGLARIMLVIHPDDAAKATALGVETVEGGANRTESVRAALRALEADAPDIVLIHDGARPLVPTALIRSVAEAAAAHGAAAPALAVTDALWRGDNGKVSGTASREGLYRAQTPQGFSYAAIRAAYEAHPGAADDDVAVARAHGIDVWIVPGAEENLKLTYPADFERAERILAARERAGSGDQKV